MMQTYLVRHWRGELPVAVAFLLNYLVVYALLVSITLAIFPQFQAGHFLVLSVFVIHTVWGLVGTARSCFKTIKGEGTVFGRPRPIIDKALAIFVLIFAVMISFYFSKDVIQLVT